MEPVKDPKKLTRKELVGCLSFIALCVAGIAFWIHSYYQAKAKEMLEWEQQRKARKEYASKYIKLGPIKITKISEGDIAFIGSTYAVSVEATNTGPRTLSSIDVTFDGLEDWIVEYKNSDSDPDSPASHRFIIFSDVQVEPGATITVGNTFTVGTYSAEVSKPVEPTPEQLKLVDIDCRLGSATEALKPNLDSRAP